MFDQATLAQLEAGYQSTQTKQKAAESTKPKVSGVKRFVAGALPIVAGAIGAVGGSALGPAGTIGGGAGGSALGEALRQRLLGEKADAKKIATEAALGAVPGVLKGAKAGVQAIKGARAAKSAETVKTSTQVAKTATVPTTGAETKPTLLSKLSTNRTRAASGIKTDPGVGGIERADDAAETFQRLKITGTPEKQLRKINEVMASHGKQVDYILAKNPIQLDGTAVKAQVAKAIEDPLKYAELDLSTPGAQRALNTHLEKFAQAKTAKEVNDYVKTLNKVATRAKAKLDKGGTVTDKEAAALAAKRSGDEVLSQYPEIAPLKRDMATLFERNADVTKKSQETVGIPILGIKSRKLAQARAGAESKMGSQLNKVDQVASSGAGQATKKMGGALFGQWGTRAVAAPLLEDQSPTSTDTTNQTTMTTPIISNTVPNIESSNTTLATNASNSSFFSDPAQVEQAYLQALNSGDSETANALIKGYELFGQSSGGGKPLSAEAAKVVSNAQTGIQALQDFNSLIDADPAAFGRTNLPGVGVLDKVTAGRASGALGTSSLNAARNQVIDVIARLRTGAAITNDEAARFEAFVPQPGDPPETRQQKINYLMGQFQMVAQRSGSAGTDLQQLAGAGA